MEELYDLVIDGAFESKEEFLSVMGDATPEELMSVMKEGAFESSEELASFIGGVTTEDPIKKKESTSEPLDVTGAPLSSSTTRFDALGEALTPEPGTPAKETRYGDEMGLGFSEAEPKSDEDIKFKEAPKPTVEGGERISKEEAKEVRGAIRDLESEYMNRYVDENVLFENIEADSTEEEDEPAVDPTKMQTPPPLRPGEVAIGDIRGQLTPSEELTEEEKLGKTTLRDMRVEMAGLPSRIEKQRVEKTKRAEENKALIKRSKAKVDAAKNELLANTGKLHVLEDDMAELNALAKKGEIDELNYYASADEIKRQAAALFEEREILKKQVQSRAEVLNIDLSIKALNDYYRKAEEGTFIGATARLLKEGYVEGAVGVSKQLTNLVKPLAQIGLSDEEKAAQNEMLDTMYEASLKGDWEKVYSTGALANATMGFDEVKDMRFKFGTSDEYMNELEKTTLGGAYAGVVKSLPMMATPGMIGIYGQVYNAVDEEIAASDELSELPAYQKELIKSSVALTGTLLERLGWKTITGEKAPLLLALTDKSIRETGGKITKETFESTLSAYLKRYVQGVKMGTLGEFETGAFQEISETSIKMLAESVLNVEGFDTPDSVAEFVERVGYAGFMEALGGKMMSSVSSAATAFRLGDVTDVTTDMYATMEGIFSDSDFQGDYDQYIDNALEAGNINEVEAAYLKSNFVAARDAIASIPSDLSLKDRTKAFRLIGERNMLEKQIEGKDENLTERQRQRIKAINEELKTISLKEREDAKETGQVREEGEQIATEEERMGDMQEQPTEEQAAEEEIERKRKEELLAVSEETKGMSDEEIEETAAERIDKRVKINERYDAELAELKSKKVAEPVVKETSVAEQQKTEPKDIEGAPEGSYINVGLLKGMSDVEMTEEEVLAALPEDVEILEQKRVEPGEGVAEPTISLKLSRALTDEEMLNLRRATDQKAVPSLSNGQGTMVGTQEWGDFDGTKFIMPDGNPLQQAEAAPTEVETENIKKLKTIVKKAKKALKKFNTNVVFATQDQIKEIAGVSDMSSGIYDPYSNTIYIDPELATIRTVAHEAVHAVLVNSLKTSSALAKATADMVSQLKSKIKDGDDLIKYLDEFSEMYQDGKNEEWVSEFTGVLFEAGKRLGKEEQSIIKKWLNEFLELVRLKPTEFGYNNTADLINSIVEGIETGSEIQQPKKLSRAYNRGKGATRTKQAKYQGSTLYDSEGNPNYKKPEYEYKSDKGRTEYEIPMSDIVSQDAKDSKLFGPLFKWHEKNGIRKVKMYRGRGDDTGIAWYINNKITINVNHSLAKSYYASQANVDLAMGHEIVHNIIDKTMPNGLKQEYNKRLKDLVNDVNRYIDKNENKVSAYVKNIMKYVNLNTPEELIAYGVTDPEVTGFLMTVPASNPIEPTETSVWQNFINILKKIFAKSRVNNNVLESAINLYEQSIPMDIADDLVVQFPRYQGVTVKQQKISKGNRLFNDPLKEASTIANEYMASKGMRYDAPEKIFKLDEKNSKAIAQEYLKMKDDIDAPGVKEAYKAVIDETMDQYKEIVKNGYYIEINNSEPYSSSADMIEDLRDNKRMKVFSTEYGFGDTPITPQMRRSNPLLADSGMRDVNGVPLLANDLFRFVHDFFGHAKYGNGFGAVGEENAWRIHSRMYSPLARKAMTSETRGQNSYVNFSGVNDEAFKLRDEARALRKEGKNVEANALVEKVYEMMKFADQKIGILPDWVVNDTKPGEQIEPEPQVKQAKAINTIEGYDRMVENVKGIIAKSQKRGRTPEEITKAVLSYVQGSAVYNRADDVQRERLTRQALTFTNNRLKPAPSVAKLFGEIKDIKKITINEKTALKESIKAQARGARNAIAAVKGIRNRVGKVISELSTNGKITLFQTRALLNKLNNMNPFNPDSVDGFVEYAAKVFRDAEYAQKMSEINKKRNTAKKNARTKTGVPVSLGESLAKIFSIRPNMIPESVLDKYAALVNMFGQKKAVLNLADKSQVSQWVSDIFQAIKEEIEYVRTLYDVFNSYDNKVLTKEGKVDFAATLTQMVKEDVISEKDRELMLKYKKDILETAAREGKSEEELEIEKQDLIASIKATIPTNETISELGTRDERDLVRELIALLRSPGVQMLDILELKHLAATLENINNGWVPNMAMVMKEKLDANNRAKYLSDRIANVKQDPLALAVANVKKMTGIWKDETKQEMMVKRGPAYFMDRLFGFSGSERGMFIAALEAEAQASEKYNVEANKLRNKLLEAQKKIAKAFYRSPNKTLESSYKITTYMLQKEFEANSTNPKQRTALEFLDATIAAYEKAGAKSTYKEADIKVLKEIRKQFKKGDSIDTEALFNSFNAAERNAIKVIREINDNLTPKAEFIASVGRGQAFTPINEYIHLQRTDQDRLAALTSGNPDLQGFYNSVFRPSTKSKTLEERTGTAGPINFDIFATVNRGVNMTLLDYHMTSAVRSTERTINKLGKLVDDQYIGETPKAKRDMVAMIRNVHQTALASMLVRDFAQTTWMDEVMEEAKKLGYLSMLAGVGRSSVEFLSNLVGAVIMDPASIMTGITKYASMGLSESGFSVMSNVNSKLTARVFPNGQFTGRLVDPTVMMQGLGIRAGTQKTPLGNALQQTWNLTGKRWRDGITMIGEMMVATPDKAIMRPVWYGSFAKRFKDVAGVEPDFAKIEKNDEAYMSKYKNEILDATRIADEKAVLIGSANNPFMGILKGSVGTGKTNWTKMLNMVNNFMQRFIIQEFVTASIGIRSLVEGGRINRRTGAALLAMVGTRMTMYSFGIEMANRILGSIMASIFGFDDDDEEKTTMDQELQKAVIQSTASLVLGRDFGAIIKNLIGYGFENYITEPYLQELRVNEDYNPYDDAIMFTQLAKDQPQAADFVQMFTGPLSPMFTTVTNWGVNTFREPYKTPAAEAKRKAWATERTAFELLGLTGMIPAYKDVRKVYIKEFHNRFKKARKQILDPELMKYLRENEPDTYKALKETEQLSDREFIKKYAPEMYDALYNTD